jgi:plastocyanin
MFALGACASHSAKPDYVQAAAATIDWASAKPVTVKLTDFDFTPSQLNIQAGQPVRLILANNGSDLHDFSAPAFFAAASFRQGGTVPAGGKVAVAQDKTVEVDLVPGAGQYPLDCTEFLHTMLGMTGTIDVTVGNVTVGNVTAAPQ